ncbi:MAG: hypothetical protein O2U62_00115 [Candidatus Bathyarchaeota archaeon]|nr:hypothetical protein [Candidatus Bathyarchaeota archaeon]
MGYIIEISSEEKDELRDKAKKLLKYGKELYECIEDLAEESQMGERGGYGNRYGNRGGGYSGGNGGGNYGNRYGNREDDGWDDDDDFGERRGVRGTGRYSRYRR